MCFSMRWRFYAVCWSASSEGLALACGNGSAVNLGQNAAPDARARRRARGRGTVTVNESTPPVVTFDVDETTLYLNFADNPSSRFALEVVRSRIVPHVRHRFTKAHLRWLRRGVRVLAVFGSEVFFHARRGSTRARPPGTPSDRLQRRASRGDPRAAIIEHLFVTEDDLYWHVGSSVQRCARRMRDAGIALFSYGNGSSQHRQQIPPSS